MLELIFKGFLEWGYGLILESWQYFSDVVMDILRMDFSYLQTHVPVIDTIMQIMLAVGWALLLGNLVFQALKSMVTGLGFEAEDPKLLFTRTFVFAFLLLASPQICEIGLNITQTIIEVLQVPDAVNITFADESIFGGIGAAWLLVIIIGIIVIFKVFGLLLEIAERYVILGMLTICAPLAFGVGGSRNTSDIFSGWCRMFASMCFMMVSNIIFFKMLLSVLSYIPTGLDVLPWMVLVLTITKVAKKVDAIITRIGLNPAITGDSLGRSLPGMLAYTVIRAATKQIAQTAGKNSGGGARGAAPKSPPGGGSGGPRTGPLSGGGHFGGKSGQSGAAAGAAGTHTSQNASTQQSGSAPTGGQNSSAAFHSTAHSSGTAQQETAQHQSTPWAPEPGSSRPGFSGQSRTSTHFGGPAAKQSAVPPGTRRAASHVRQPQPGMAGMGFSGQNTQQGKEAHGPTTAKTVPGQSQFSESTRQSIGTDTTAAEYNSQQQNVSASASIQNQQPAKGSSGTRFSDRPAPGSGRQQNGMAGNGAHRPQAQTAPAPSTVRQESKSPLFTAKHPEGSDATSRHGRNVAPSPAAPAPVKSPTTSRTARQERPSSMSEASFRGAGTAGAGGAASSAKQHVRPGSQAAARARPGPRVAGRAGSEDAASHTAGQEASRFSERNSGQKAKEGDADGE